MHDNNDRVGKIMAVKSQDPTLLIKLYRIQSELKVNFATSPSSPPEILIGQSICSYMAAVY